MQKDLFNQAQTLSDFTYVEEEQTIEFTINQTDSFIIELIENDSILSSPNIQSIMNQVIDYIMTQSEQSLKELL